MKKIYILTLICITVVISSFFVWKIFDRKTTIIEKFKDIDIAIYETVTEIREYFNEVKSKNGDELIVAETTYFTEIKLSDTQREFWTSLIFNKGISLGTNTVEIRCPTVHKYYIKISDPWVLNVKNGVICIKQPVIKHLNPPSVKLERMEIKSDRGWARGSTKEMQKDALNIFMNEAIKRGSKSIPRVTEKANKSIVKFVKNWILNLKGIDIDAVSVEIVKSMPNEIETNDILIQLDKG